MHNVEIAWAFYELADLLEFKGEDFFKIRAYRQAARVISGLTEPVEEMYRLKSLTRVAGIGKNIASKIGELVEKGKMDKLERLRKEIPRGLLEIMALPGIGPKRAAFLHQNLGIESMSDLEKAASERKIRFLKGMGAKTELDIISNINTIKSRSGKFLLGMARELAVDLCRYIEGLPGVQRVEVTGSVRRWRETVEDVDLLTSATDFDAPLNGLAYHSRTREVVERSDNYIRVMTWWGIPVEMVAVRPENFWWALLWETGSPGHLEELAAHAAVSDLELNRDGVSRRGPGESAGPYQSEEEIYSMLNLKYIPPELREGAGEVESAKTGLIPGLVKVRDIRGDLHVHSNWSDGAASIEDIVNRAREKGYSYVAITDHSRSLKIARGLSEDSLQEQYAEIDSLNKKLEGIKVLKGVEVDILSGGGLDFNDEILEKADVVVASVHSGFKQDRETITSRIMEAVKNPHVDIIGHLTGRLLGHREGYDVDVKKILEEAGKRAKIMEINASPDRLDLNETHTRMAVDFGARIAINTDAHDLKRMDEMEYGVSVARRAGLEPSDIVNTMELKDLLKALSRTQ